MNFNKPTSWIQAAIVASSMLLPGACSKAKDTPLESDGLTPRECQEEVLPEEALEFLQEIATKLRILCPEGFEENGYPCNRIDGDGSTTLRYASQSGNQTTQYLISLIGGREDDNTTRIRVNHSTFCQGAIGEGTRDPAKSTIHNESTIDLKGETVLQGEIAHDASLKIEPLNEKPGSTSVISFSALNAEPATLTQKEAVNILQQSGLPTHLTE